MLWVLRVTHVVLGLPTSRGGLHVANATGVLALDRRRWNRTSSSTCLLSVMRCSSVTAGLLLVFLFACTTTTPQPVTGTPARPGTVAFRASGSPTPSSGRCRLPQGRDAYRPQASSTSGTKGSSVTISGNTPLLAKSGRYIGPVGLIGFWWNLPPSGWEHVYFGQTPPATSGGTAVIHLGEVLVKDQCSYRVSFLVPDVPQGLYPILPIEHGHGGAAAFATLEFRVTG